MIKLVFCLRRLEHLSRDEFQKYWYEQHAPLVREHAAAIGVVRYVQVHTGHDAMNEALRASRGGPEAYDGVAELWFESEAAMATKMATDEGRAAALALLEDEKRFIDLARSPLWLSDERPVIDASNAPNASDASDD